MERTCNETQSKNEFFLFVCVLSFSPHFETRGKKGIFMTCSYEKKHKNEISGCRALDV